VPLDIDKIKALREKLGLTQAQAAEKAGLTGRQSWSVLETGLRSNPSLRMIERIAGALGVKARDLLK
jgi:transcriptional regulator with XRE-family HTH domain